MPSRSAGERWTQRFMRTKATALRGWRIRSTRTNGWRIFSWPMSSRRTAVVQSRNNADTLVKSNAKAADVLAAFALSGQVGRCVSSGADAQATQGVIRILQLYFVEVGIPLLIGFRRVKRVG